MLTDNFVGEAELSLFRENRAAEGRHILPLTSASDTTYGSLTVEVRWSLCRFPESVPHNQASISKILSIL